MGRRDLLGVGGWRGDGWGGMGMGLVGVVVVVACRLLGKGIRKRGGRREGWEIKDYGCSLVGEALGSMEKLRLYITDMRIGCSVVLAGTEKSRYRNTSLREHHP